MARKPYRALAGIDAKALARFQAGIRKRYSDEQILDELRASAERLNRSPTMREFAADPETTVHPQTVIEHFGSWNEAKRAAGLVPRRFATRAELVGLLRALGEELGRVPTARDLDERRGSFPSKSLYWHTFGSLASALREAGQRRLALVRRAHGRQRFLLECHVGAERITRADAAVVHGEHGPFGELALLELDATVTLGQFQRVACRSEEELGLRATDPERP